MGNYLEVTSLDVPAAGNAWAVGLDNRLSDDALIGIAEHWNGKTWQRVPSAEIPATLWDVASANHEVWVVGGSNCETLVLTGPAS